MKNAQIAHPGVLDDRQILSELVEEVDPVIGEASAAIGAMTTEIIRRTLRGGVLQVGREVSQFVGNEVRKQIVEQQPLIEKTAAITATEVARGEVEALRLAATEQDKLLAERIDEATRQSHEQAQTIARELAGRLEETSRKVDERADSVARDLASRLEETSRLAHEQTETVARVLVGRIEETTKKVEERTESVSRDFATRLEEKSRETHQRIEVVAKTADETARQTSETAAQLSRAIESEVAAVETRTLESARKELTDQVEVLRERARNTTAKFMDRLDKQDAATSQLVAQQSALKQELNEAMRIERKQLIKELQVLRRANEALMKRVEVLEQPRGLRAFFARLFGKKKAKPTEAGKIEATEERDA